MKTKPSTYPTSFLKQRLCSFLSEITNYTAMHSLCTFRLARLTCTRSNFLRPYLAANCLLKLLSPCSCSMGSGTKGIFLLFVSLFVWGFFMFVYVICLALLYDQLYCKVSMPLGDYQYSCLVPANSLLLVWGKDSS